VILQAQRAVVGFVLIVLVLAVAPFAGAQAPPASPPPVPGQTQAQPTQPHSEQAYSLPPDKLLKAKALNKIRLALDIGGAVWGLLVLWWLLASRAAARLERWTQRKTSRRWVQGLLFFAAFILITTLAGLPLDMIGHTASRHYGISVQGWGGWFGDQGKGLAISLLFGALIMLFFNWIVRKSPRAYWVWIWLISLPLILALVFISPLVIDPLFNKFEPLTQHHAQLASRLEEVVAKTGTNIPPERMFLMKASLKSNGLNAYVTGIGSSKRFVMWDTVTDRVPDDEIMFVFGHESGHYVLNHIPKMLSVMAVVLFFVFWGCARFAEWLVRRFGSRWQIGSVSERAGFVTLLFAFSIVSFLLTPAGNTFGRHFEHQADVYGQEAVHGLVPDPQKTAVSGFNHLGEAWLEDPDPSPIVEFWLYNHPSVQTRAKFAEHYNPWANGGHGEFFKN
jgi:Zn-dependent protease with chaperone function